MKKTTFTKLALITFISFTFFNCEKDTEDIFQEQQVDAKSVHVCVPKWDATTSGKATSVKDLQWETGQTIRVKFLNGSSYVQSKVKQYAVEWEKYANLKFEWVSSSSSANIKITFKEGEYADDAGSWSHLGTNSNLFDRSMHFGWFNNNTSESSFRKTTIHEFGHALGLIHEHQNPVAGINWDKETVYEYYAGAPNYWSKEQVDTNLFQRYDANITNYSTYDPKSIMHYPVPAEHTLDGVGVGQNSYLSATDKAFIGSIYPFPDTGNICDGVSEYNSNASYSVGDRVLYNGTVYERTSSGWSNLGECPSTDPCDGVAPYNSNTSYSVGDQVTYNGTLYERGSNGWNNLGPCGS